MLAIFVFRPQGARALQAPNFELASPVGAPWRGRIRLRDERGKAIVLVFWAGSCRHCHADLVAFERLYRRLRARGLLVVGIAIDDARAAPALVGTIRRLGLSFPIVADPGGRTCVRYDPLRAFPLAVVVGRRGELLRMVELRSRARLAELERVAAELVGVRTEEDDAAADVDDEPEEPRRAAPRRRREADPDHETEPDQDADGDDDGDDDRDTRREADGEGDSDDEAEQDDDSSPERDGDRDDDHARSRSDSRSDDATEDDR